MSATLDDAQCYHARDASLLTSKPKSFGSPSDVGLLENTSFVRWLIMPAVSRISLRSAAPQRDGANEKGASTELEATASRILLFRDLLGAGEYSAQAPAVYRRESRGAFLR